MSPSQLSPGPLPIMWQLYPGQRYRGSDSRFWRIVYHIQASVCFRRDPCPAPALASAPKTKNQKNGERKEGICSGRFLKGRVTDYRWLGGGPLGSPTEAPTAAAPPREGLPGSSPWVRAEGRRAPRASPRVLRAAPSWWEAGSQDARGHRGCHLQPPSLCRWAAERTCSLSACQTRSLSDMVSAWGPGHKEGAALLQGGGADPQLTVPPRGSRGPLWGPENLRPGHASALGLTGDRAVAGSSHLQSWALPVWAVQLSPEDGPGLSPPRSRVAKPGPRAPSRSRCP